MEMLYIQPGSPWENGCAESFHSRLRDELLNAEVFADVMEAKALGAKRLHEYNRRPHSSPGYLPPAMYAASLAGSAVGATALPPARPAASPVEPTLELQLSWHLVQEMEAGYVP
jgi:hypothetical protein